MDFSVFVFSLPGEGCWLTVQNIMKQNRYKWCKNRWKKETSLCFLNSISPFPRNTWLKLLLIMQQKFMVLKKLTSQFCFHWLTPYQGKTSLKTSYFKSPMSYHPCHFKSWVVSFQWCIHYKCRYSNKLHPKRKSIWLRLLNIQICWIFRSKVMVLKITNFVISKLLPNLISKLHI